MRFATLSDHVPGDKLTAIDHAAELGFDGLELVVPDDVHDVGAHGMSLDPDHPPITADPVWSGPGRADLAERAADRELAIPSLCPSFMNMRPGLVGETSEERETAITRLTQLITAAADLDAGTILVPFFMEAEIEDDTDRDRVIAALEQLAPTAADAGVTLAIETTLDAADNKAILEAVNHPGVGLYYDVANVLAYGYDPAAEIRELGAHIAQVHFKDRGPDGGHAMLGDGQVDFEAVAAALVDIGYDDWIALETSYESDPMAAMAENLAFARELMATHR